MCFRCTLLLLKFVLTSALPYGNAAGLILSPVFRIVQGHNVSVTAKELYKCKNFSFFSFRNWGKDITEPFHLSSWCKLVANKAFFGFRNLETSGQLAYYCVGSCLTGFFLLSRPHGAADHPVPSPHQHLQQHHDQLAQGRGLDGHRDLDVGMHPICFR